MCVKINKNLNSIKQDTNEKTLRKKPGFDKDVKTDAFVNV